MLKVHWVRFIFLSLFISLFPYQFFFFSFIPIIRFHFIFSFTKIEILSTIHLEILMLKHSIFPIGNCIFYPLIYIFCLSSFGRTIKYPMFLVVLFQNVYFVCLWSSPIFKTFCLNPEKTMQKEIHDFGFRMIHKMNYCWNDLEKNKKLIFNSKLNLNYFLGAKMLLRLGNVNKNMCQYKVTIHLSQIRAQFRSFDTNLIIKQEQKWHFPIFQWFSRISY